MSLQIVVDMNLSPDWVAWFANYQWRAVHWSTIGNPKATDEAIMRWARENQHVVFTHDLDFGTLLALTNATGPSVIQVRAQDVFPEHLGRFILAALRQYQTLIEQGALMVIDERTTRVRLLPLRSEE